MREIVSPLDGLQSPLGGRRIKPLLLDTYSGAAAAYSLRSLSKETAGTPVVRVRRSLDNAEQDFTAKAVEDGTLEAFVNEIPTTKPADYGSGAAAAYSLRVVSDSYTGPVVRVRESSGNTEQDFTAEEITDGTLEAFVGAGNDGFVTTWYDQSGNSNDATQSTAASQPKIVDAGVLVTENGKAAIKAEYNGGLDFDNSFLDISNFYVAICFYNKTGFSSGFIAGLSQFSFVQRLYFHQTYYRVNDLAEFSVSFEQDQYNLAAINCDQGDVDYYNNGSLLGSDTHSLTGSENPGRIFYLNNSPGNLGSAIVSELIIYPSDQSSNRTLIESEINDYYGIYTPTSDGFVTTWYDQSGNSNDATQSTAASQPKIVSGGSLVTEGGKAAIDFDGVNDYLSAEDDPDLRPSELSIFSVFNTAGAGRMDLFCSGDSGKFSTNNFILGTNDPTNYSVFGRSPENQFTGTILNSYSIITLIASNNNDRFDIYQNSTIIGSESPFQIGIDNTTGFSIGTSLRDGSTGEESDALVSELILYPSDQSSNRVGIETNINNHYRIY